MIPVFEGLLDEPHSAHLMKVLYWTAEWHGFAKLRMHTNTTIGHLEMLTKEFGQLMRQFRDTTMLRFYPHFSLSLIHMTPHALSFPCHLPTCAQHVPPNHGTYSRLHRTYVHYPIRPCPCLVPYGCAVASYHIPLTRSSMTHSSPFSTIHLPHLVCFLIPIYVTDTSPSSEALCFFL